MLQLVIYFIMNVVNKNLEVRIYPSKVDKNDKGEKIASLDSILSNIGISRFIFNQELAFINNFRRLLVENGYEDKVIVNNSSCNCILKMLKSDYSFMEKSESSSRQQSQRDLITAFKRYHNPNLKSNYPRFKKKKDNKGSFRIMNNNNNVRIQKDKYGYDKIKLAKLGLVKFKTSKKYKELLHKATDKNDQTAKINHITIKKENDKYYAVFNIECIHTPHKIIGPKQQIGIDIGCGKLAVLSNKQEIPNLDLTKETEKIIHYTKIMSHTRKNSNRYQKAKKLYQKWMKKLVNKRNDYYNKITTYIVQNSSFIAVQNENIIAWKKNKHLSHNLQLNAPRTFMDKIEYKCKWNNIPFIKVPKKFPSTQICSNCKKQNTNIKGIQNIRIRTWKCQKCNTIHDRDINASINILNEGLKIVGTTMQ